MRSWVILSGATLFIAACGSDGDDLFGSASSGGAGGTGGEGGSSSTSSNGTGGGSGEDCLNSTDDDKDGLIDCQDSDCQADYQCVPIPPAGWKGVGYLSGLTAADCPAEMTASQDLYEQSELNAPPATCSCSCTGAGVMECQVPLACYDGHNCFGSPMPADVGDTCEPHPLPLSPIFSCTAGPPMAVSTGATCAVDVVNVDLPPVSWPSSKSVCLTEPGGFCDAATICVPRKPANASGPCIAKAGNHDCPASYAQKSVYYDGTYDDSRGCGACSCGSAPTGAVCSCTSSNCGVAIFNQPGCTSGLVAFVPAGGGCTNATNSQPGFITEARTAGVQLTHPGTCDPGWAPAVGGVSFNQGTITLCCDL